VSSCVLIPDSLSHSYMSAERLFWMTRVAYERACLVKSTVSLGPHDNAADLVMN